MPTPMDDQHLFTYPKGSIKARHTLPNHQTFKIMVDIHDPLPKVELCVCLGCSIFNLDEGGVGVGVGLCTIVPKEVVLGVESGMGGKGQSVWSLGN
jgi:hypothetical protein